MSLVVALAVLPAWSGRELAGHCPSWCNPHTCGNKGECGECDFCVGDVCLDWCNEHTCGAARCKACTACGGELSLGMTSHGTAIPSPSPAGAPVASLAPHCESWCNPHTCGAGACKDCDDCTAIAAGEYCAPWCNEFTCGNKAMCSGCAVCSDVCLDIFKTYPNVPVMKGVGSLPACPAVPTTFPVSSAYTDSAPEEMLATDAFVPGASQLVSMTNCGRANFGSENVAFGSVETADGFGALTVSGRLMGGSGIVVPAGIDTADNGENYFYTQNGGDPVDGSPYIQTYAACDYGGHLAYCSEHLEGYDYDFYDYDFHGNGGEDRTFCFGMKQEKYCDGTASVAVYYWKIMQQDAFTPSLYEHANWGDGAYQLKTNDPFNPNEYAKKYCKTDLAMPEWTGEDDAVAKIQSDVAAAAAAEAALAEAAPAAASTPAVETCDLCTAQMMPTFVGGIFG